jgi:photolyase PhrII
MRAELYDRLPKILSERTRLWRGSSSDLVEGFENDFVLYWMSSAVRIEENPALEVATFAANELSLPLLVCQELSEEHPYASDRHFVFELEGAREVQIYFAETTAHYVFNLRKHGTPSRIEQLIASSALVIIEDMPVPSEVKIKFDALTSAKVVWAVDTACVLPMNLVGKAYTRAFAFRRATSKERTARLKVAWPKYLPPTTRLESLFIKKNAKRLKDVSFEVNGAERGETTLGADRHEDDEIDLSTLDLSKVDLYEYVLTLDIDHSIPPAGTTRGGTTAGYTRWEEFKKQKLAKYARDRNDPLLDPSSRLSAYLRLGHISPFRIAREAANSGAAGAYKFLDELLIWRELSYTFCRFFSENTEDLDSLNAIPEWARKSLEEHEGDQRVHSYSWASLARGKTASALWNEAQGSLCLAGELHNNLRMTWGKAFISWTKNAREAQSKMIDLNHRFALDGNDPSSYGGLLWTMGQFDRPFTPEKPIFGTVRPRPLEQHARRLNVENYSASVRTKKPKRIGIIGSGISGLMCGQILHDQGFEVQLFDKGLNTGGRVATRSTRELADVQFDHGAQYFTAKSSLFRRHVNSWVEDGSAAIWEGKIATLQNGEMTAGSGSHERFVGIPSMRSIAEYLAKDLNVKTKTRAVGLQLLTGKWVITFDSGAQSTEFDAIVLAIPPAQAADLLQGQDKISEICKSIKMAPCWATMVAFEERLPIDADGIFVKSFALAWIARDSSKPGRQPGERWVLHATPEWSEEHIEDEQSLIQDLMISEFFRLVGLEVNESIFARSHRWRYAIPSEESQKTVIESASGSIIVCGDYCHGARVEGAFLSGVEAAARLIRSADLISQRL